MQPEAVRGPIRLELDPRLGGLRALGVEHVEELLGSKALSPARAQQLESRENRARLRFPLPGTPETADGVLSGEPRGAGTGWVVLERFRGSPWRELLSSRFTHPRSASLAERRWNILCHLRSSGVATPEPLAVGALGRGLVSRDSFLVTRELESVEAVPEWLARETNSELRGIGIRALGAALGKLLGAGVRLPHVASTDFVISIEAPASEEACAFDAREFPAGLPRNRMPAIALVDVEGAALCGRLRADEMAELIRRLDDASLRISERERGRILLRALADLTADERRAVRRMLLG